MTANRRTRTSSYPDDGSSGDTNRDAPVLRIDWDAQGDPEHIVLDFESGE